MPSTYEPIATQTLVSASTISFTSIPATYTDLRLVIIATKSSGSALLRFNSNSGTNYSFTLISGDGSTASSGAATSQTEFALSNSGWSTTIPQMSIVDIFSYAGSTNKTILISSAYDYNGSGYVENQVGLWRQTSAITSIQLLMTFAAGSTATLYGIKNA